LSSTTGHSGPRSTTRQRTAWTQPRCIGDSRSWRRGSALGGRGHLATTIEDVERAAREFVDDPRPTVIDVRIAPNVVGIPYRRAFSGEA
jgi:thiamine pyrophosphate-dependent acetolactate synthase large subunit-like protein